MSDTNIVFWFRFQDFHHQSTRTNSTVEKRGRKKKPASPVTMFFSLFSPENMFLLSLQPPPLAAPPPPAGASHEAANEPSNRKAVIYNSHGSRPRRRYSLHPRLPATLPAADSLQSVFCQHPERRLVHVRGHVAGAVHQDHFWKTHRKVERDLKVVQSAPISARH